MSIAAGPGLGVDWITPEDHGAAESDDESNVHSVDVNLTAGVGGEAAFTVIGGTTLSNIGPEADAELEARREQQAAREQQALAAGPCGHQGAPCVVPNRPPHRRRLAPASADLAAAPPSTAEANFGCAAPLRDCDVADEGYGVLLPDESSNAHPSPPRDDDGPSRPSREPAQAPTQPTQQPAPAEGCGQIMSC